VPTRKNSNLKKTEGTIRDTFKELEKLDIEKPARIFRLSPTFNCEGWLAVFIDIPSLKEQNSPLKTEAETSATEPLNNIAKSALAG
jgi:hypothetical protein